MWTFIECLVYSHMVDKNRKGVEVNCKGEKDSSVIHCIIPNLRTAAIKRAL
jgi:hypothetical protein